jgi:hypothetical protein
LSDGLTWFFARGPRRTISTAGTYDRAGQRRMLLWTANIDEVHDVEAIVRGVEGGVGAMLWSSYPSDLANFPQLIFDGKWDPAKISPGTAPKPTSVLRNGLNGSLAELIPAVAPGHESEIAVCDASATFCDVSQTSAWNDIDAYIQSVRTPRAPSNLVPEEVADGQRLFQDARCGACHAGNAFTISRVFYAPGAAANGALPNPPAARPAAILPEHLGSLRTTYYDVPPELRALNPAGASGSATLRRWPAGDMSDVADVYTASLSADDQINCILRDVGTYPAAGTDGITAPGAPRVSEVRQDMTTPAQGATGYNIPSLLGLFVGAPYFHAGNARTLEESFDATFAAHFRAFEPRFLAQSQTRAQRIHDLVAYLLSIDESTPSEAVPTDLGFQPDLCPAAH